MIELARQYGSYGYRRVAVLLRDAGWQVSVVVRSAVTSSLSWHSKHSAYWLRSNEA